MRGVSFSYKSFEALATHQVGGKVEEVQDTEQAKESARLYAKWNIEDRLRSKMNAYIARNDDADEHLEKNFQASGDARMWHAYACHVNRNRNNK